MDQNELRETLRAGIEAAKSRNTIIARNHLRRVLDVDPDNELAWLWMAQASDSKSDREEALRRVLAINPNNQKARDALEKMTGEDVYEVYSSSSSLGQSSAPASPSRRDPVEQERDWLQPVQRPRRDTDLWRSKRQDDNSLTLLLGIGLAIAIIGFAIFLLIGELDTGDDETPDVQTVDLGATQTAQILLLTPIDTLVPSRTPVPTSPLLLTPRSNQLPPTLAPTITNTPLPTDTPTPVPPGPDIFEVLITSNASPGEPSRLFVAQGDGTNFERFTVDFERFTGGAAPAAETEPEPEPTDAPEATAPPAEPESTETDEDSAESEETNATDDGAAMTNPFNDNGLAMLRLQGVRVEFFDPVYSPNAAFIAFTMQINDVQEIYSTRADGQGNMIQLTFLGASETRGAEWSPDGSQIIFHSNADGDFDLYTIPDAGGDAVNVTNNNFTDREPSYSPDGRFVAFASDRAGGDTLEIFVIGLGGMIESLNSELVESNVNECQLTDAQDSSFSPAWSPDGQRIAFISNRDRDNDLYIMNADGSNEQIISFGDGSSWQERFPAWSPDGRWIAVTSNRVDDAFNTDSINPTSKIWLVQPNGQDWQRITAGDSNELQLAWAPSPFFVNEITDFEFRCAAN